MSEEAGGPATGTGPPMSAAMMHDPPPVAPLGPPRGYPRGRAPEILAGDPAVRRPKGWG
jgi:hypothetical protein